MLLTSNYPFHALWSNIEQIKHKMASINKNVCKVYKTMVHNEAHLQTYQRIY